MAGLLRAQAGLPRLVEAHQRLADVVMLADGALPRRMRSAIGLVVAADRGCRYGLAAHGEALRAAAPAASSSARLEGLVVGLSPVERAGLALALKVARAANTVTAADFDALRALGWNDAQILDAVVAAAHALCECTVATGLGVAPEFEVPEVLPLRPLLEARLERSSAGNGRPLPAATGPGLDAFAPMVHLREVFGLVPNLFRILMLRPDIVHASAEAIRLVLLPEDVLSRARKERLFVAISARNLSSYCVAAHCELLRGLGVPAGHSDQIAVDHHQAGLSPEDTMLIDVGLQLVTRPRSFDSAELNRLRTRGFSEPQILEAIAMCGLAQFMNACSMGLMAEPDFALPSAFSAAVQGGGVRPRVTTRPDAAETPSTVRDPDADVVERVRAGETDAFEDLVRRHGRRVHVTIAGILRRDDEVEDAVQDTFVSAFRNLARFEARSTFITWLTRIAINTALQRLRRRRDVESLDEDTDDDVFQPRHVRAWHDDPERLYDRARTRALVWEAVMALPLKYRVVVMLRDLQQLSTAETAAALEMAIPGVKARLLRGRLMLRETLAPHFARETT